MIQLSKLPEPQWLRDNSATKTTEYANAAADNKPRPWRNDEIVATLRAETGNKCMYCEIIADDSGYSAVEHIKPKHIFPELVLQWENLGLVCERCNTNKGTYWTDTVAHQLVNPFSDTVEDHVEFEGPLTVPALNSSRGRQTVKKLKLMSRPDLLLSRMARIEQFDEALRLWHSEEDYETKDVFAQEIVDAASPGQEHAGVLKNYAISRGFPSSRF